ncbi:hypothetical protein BG015_004682, partial [Linnemannia schmuckeri]
MDNTTATTPAPAHAPAAPAASAAPATTTTTTTNTPPPPSTSTSSSSADNSATTASTTTTPASSLTRNRSQRAPRKEKSGATTTGNAPNSNSGSSRKENSNRDKENRPPKKDKTTGEGASTDKLNDALNTTIASKGAEQTASTTTTNNNSRNNRRQSSKPKSRSDATAVAANPASADGAATAASSASSDHAVVSDPASSKKPQSDDTKKSGSGRNSSKKQTAKTGNSRASSAATVAATEVGENFGVVVPTPAVDGQAAAPLTPKRNERLSTSVNGSGNDRRKSTTHNINNNTTSNNSNQGKKRNNNNKEPTKSAAAAVGSATTVTTESEAASTPVDPARTPANAKRTSKKPAPANREGSAAAPKAKSNTASRSQGGSSGNRQSTAAPKDRNSNKGGKDQGTADATQPSKEGRPSSISSSCSFVTSSSSLSPSSPLSPASPSSSFPSPSAAAPTAFTEGNKDAPVTAISTKDLRRESAHGRSNRTEITRIKTNVPRDGASPTSGPLGGFPVAHSPLTAASPSSRRSSALTPHGDKFGRLGGLPTVEENVAEKPAEVVAAAVAVPESSSIAHSAAPRRGHARTLSMKEQLDQLGQDTKEGKTIESLQDIISSLKSLPPTTSALSHPDHPLTQGTSRHEKRLSMSSLPANAAAGHLAGGAVPSTTLHLSQPPRGTTIENALQSTVATLRRLSVSDSKRPLIPLNEEESQVHAPVKSNNNRRSVAFTKDIAPIAENFDDNKRTSSYQPNRRSVIIRPEEVAALQEGRQYVPSAFSFSSDDEPEDGVANALSALEGKGTTSNRSSYSVKLVHQRTSSSVDPASLAEFAATLPSHLKGLGAAALVNNDDAHDRRRFTTAFAAGNRISTVTSSANKRLSTMNALKDSDRKDWRMSTPMSAAGNRDSIYGKDNANGRRPLFMAHLTYSDFHTLLTKQKTKYVQGVLRINKRNRSDAYVTVDSLPEGDVYICGSKDRNRALEGDVVEEVAEPESDEIKPKYCGRVVSIVERSISQMFSGTLTLQRPSGSSKKNDRKKQDEEDQKGQPRIVWFKP